MERTYVTSLPDGTLVRWKPLTWSEYRWLIKQFGHLTQGAAEWLLYEAVAALCVLDQDQNGHQVAIDELLAGTIQVVGQQIIQESGFVSDVELLKSHRERSRTLIHGDWYEEVLTYIMAFFRIPEKDIREWTVRQFMDYAVRVEQLLGKELPILSVEEVEQKNSQVRMTTMPDGRRIPVVTKQTLNQRKKIDWNDDVAGVTMEQKVSRSRSVPQRTLRVPR